MVEDKKDKKDQSKVGKITHYFGKLGVGIVELTDNLEVGDKIAIKGATTDIEQTVESMELEHKEMTKVKKGDAVGLKVSDKVREGDTVYKL